MRTDEPVWILRDPIPSTVDSVTLLVGDTVERPEDIIRLIQRYGKVFSYNKQQYMITFNFSLCHKNKKRIIRKHIY